MMNPKFQIIKKSFLVQRNKIQRMKDLVNTTNTNLIRYQNSVDSQITHGTNKISIHTATKLREIATMASEQTHKYSIDIGDTVRKYHGQFGETITTGINRLQDQYNTFENTLGRNIESALDYVDREIKQYKTSVKELAHRANGIHGANANGEQVNSGANKHEIKRNPRFPNVNMAAIQNQGTLTHRMRKTWNNQKTNGIASGHQTQPKREQTITPITTI